jgi:hypothetical protein
LHPRQNQDLLDLLQKMSKEAEKNLAELRQKEAPSTALWDIDIYIYIDIRI